MRLYRRLSALERRHAARAGRDAQRFNPARSIAFRWRRIDRTGRANLRSVPELYARQIKYPTRRGLSQFTRANHTWTGTSGSNRGPLPHGGGVGSQMDPRGPITQDRESARHPWSCGVWRGRRTFPPAPELVEAGGIEPPSASTTHQDLHAYPVYCSRAGLPDRQGRPDASSVLFNAALPGTRARRDPVIATPAPPAQARKGVELAGLKPPERSCCRSQLEFANGLTRNLHLGMHLEFRNPRRNRSPPRASGP